MSAPTNPPPKSNPLTAHWPVVAEAAPATTGSGAPKVVAREGVLSDLRSNQQQRTGSWGDGRVPVAWLHVVAPPDWKAIPTGTSKCACGRDRSAVGRRRVRELIEQHEYHRHTCPLLGNETEGREAA